MLEEWREYRRVVRRLFMLVIAVTAFAVISYVAILLLRSAELELTRHQLRRLIETIEAFDAKTDANTARIEEMVQRNHGEMDMILRLIEIRIRVERKEQEEDGDRGRGATGQAERKQ